MTIHAFDFDGTLTRRDTLIEFIRYVKGNKEFLIGFLKHLHLLIMMKLGIMPNWKTKRIIFQYFFGGMTLEKFNEYCEKFAKEKASLLRKKGMVAVNKAVMDGDQVVIISASIENWVEPFFRFQVSNNINIIGTKIQVVDGKLTGRFLTKNCYGEEKVRRLLEQYPDRKLVACMELHTFSSLTEEFLKQYAHAMDEADTAMVYYSPAAVQHKKLPPIHPEMIFDAFQRKDLSVFNDSNLLRDKLLETDWHHSVLLLMSSGNFDGINLNEFGKKIVLLPA